MALCTWILGQNLKHWIFEVIAGNLEKRISVMVLDYVWDVLRIYLEYIWHIFGICLDYI